MKGVLGAAVRGASLQQRPVVLARIHLSDSRTTSRGCFASASSHLSSVVSKQGVERRVRPLLRSFGAHQFFANLAIGDRKG